MKRERGSLRLVVESVKTFFKLMRLIKNKNKKNKNNYEFLFFKK